MDAVKKVSPLLPPTSWPVGGTVIPGVSATKAGRVLPLGTESNTSRDTTFREAAVRVSTTGLWPDTVMVSDTDPTLNSALTVAVKFVVSWTPSRLNVLKPARLKVTAYVPTARSTILYWTWLSVTALRALSMSAGLEASTVTPGSTAPEVSLATPATLLVLVCAVTSGAISVSRTNAKSVIAALTINPMLVSLWA